METKPIVESLLFYTSNREHLEKSFIAARILNKDRSWTAKENSEFRAHLSHFKEPSVLVTIGLIVSVYVIVQNQSNVRLLDVVVIEGRDSTIAEMSRSKLSAEANKSLNIKDFMPPGLHKQVLWMPFKPHEHVESTSEDVETELLNITKNNNIENYNTADIVMFTEHIREEWTVDKDISSPSPKTVAVTTQKEIITNIVREVK